MDEERDERAGEMLEIGTESCLHKAGRLIPPTRFDLLLEVTFVPITI